MSKLTVNDIVTPDDNYINHLGLKLDQKFNFHLHITTAIIQSYRKVRIA